MSGSAWLTMGLVAGVVWGGFLVLLALALRSEAGRRRDVDTPAERG